MERGLSLLYLSWLPFVAFSDYLAKVTGLSFFSKYFWLLGAVPYFWTAHLLGSKLGKRRRKGSLIILVLALLIIAGLFFNTTALGVALGTSAFLAFVALRYRYSSAYVEVLVSVALPTLTFLGSFKINPWESLTDTMLGCFSVGATLHSVRGLYEVMPYVEKG